MRFAYIDSQGNEVTIPSVDALALRIELGAIGPETELYDGQADRWGPAHSHEIFHTLSRDVGGDDFLVPAPPATPPEEPANPVEDDAAADRPAPPADLSSPFDGSFGLTLAPSEREGPSGPDDSAEDDGPQDAPEDFGFAEMSFDLAPSDPSGWAAADAPPGESGEGRTESGRDAVDESTTDDESGGLWLEEPLDADASEDRNAAEQDLGGGLDLEPPMSDFDPSAPPAWMEQDGPSGFADDGPAMDFSPDAEDARIADEPGHTEGPGWDRTESVRLPSPGSERPEPQPTGVERPTRKPPSRTPPRRSPPRRSVVRPLLLLLLITGVAAGGWYGWQLLAARPAAAPPRPAVVIPEIPAELEGPMRELADEALPLMYSQIANRAFPAGEPQAPSDEWLAGVYLGNASRFAEVEAFWAAVAGFANRLRDEEMETFHAAYVSRAEAANHDEDTRALLVERADSGFMATREARLLVYERLDTLAGAALALHDFLLTHQSDIAYTPARGFAGNPIEEAVPSSPEIGDQMWDRVEDITNALDALGTLDRVTRERLSSVVLERIRDIGIR